MIFLSNWVIFRVPLVNFPGCVVSMGKAFQFCFSQAQLTKRRPEEGRGATKKMLKCGFLVSKPKSFINPIHLYKMPTPSHPPGCLEG